MTVFSCPFAAVLLLAPVFQPFLFNRDFHSSCLTQPSLNSLLANPRSCLPQKSLIILSMFRSTHWLHSKSCVLEQLTLLIPSAVHLNDEISHDLAKVTVYTALFPVCPIRKILHYVIRFFVKKATSYLQSSIVTDTAGNQETR